PPALGIRRVNSIRLLPVARIATAARTNAHGAIEPMAITMAGMVRNTLSAGAMLASVLDVVPNRPIESARSSAAGPALVVAGTAVSLIAVHHLSVRCRQARRCTIAPCRLFLQKRSCTSGNPDANSAHIACQRPFHGALAWARGSQAGDDPRCGPGGGGLHHDGVGRAQRVGGIGLYLPDDTGSFAYYLALAGGAARQALAHGLALTLIPPGQDPA